MKPAGVICPTRACVESRGFLSVSVKPSPVTTPENELDPDSIRRALARSRSASCNEPETRPPVRVQWMNIAALRAFQRDWMDCDSVSIAEAWPMHFDVQGEGDEREVVPQPLGSEDIDALCERINCAKILAIS